LDVNSTFLMQNSVCFGMQQKDIPEEIREVVGGMRRDFRFAPELKTSLLGRTIEEIEKSKIFPVKGFCPEQVVVGASRFQKKGFPSYVRVYRRDKSKRKYHFVLEVVTRNGNFTIDFRDGGNVLVDRTVDWVERRPGIRSSKKPFSLKENQSLSEMFKSPLISFRSAIKPLLPRNWPLKINRKKNSQAAKRLNSNWSIRRR